MAVVVVLAAAVTVRIARSGVVDLLLGGFTALDRSEVLHLRLTFSRSLRPPVRGRAALRVLPTSLAYYVPTTTFSLV